MIPRWTAWVLLAGALGLAVWGFARLEGATDCVPPTTLGCSVEGKPVAGPTPNATDALGLGLLVGATFLAIGALFVGTQGKGVGGRPPAAAPPLAPAPPK